MKQLLFDLGGRPFVNDDLQALQRELTDAITAPYTSKGAFIVHGCQVSGPSNGAYVVAAGILFLNGELMRFPGQSSVTLPAQLQAGTPLTSDYRQYQVGGSKDCMRETQAVLVAFDPSYTGQRIEILSTYGGKTWQHVQQALQRTVSAVEWLANFGSTEQAYYVNGLGQHGSPAWGWALCDGRNGTADLRGRFVAGLDPAQADYDVVGDTGGEEFHRLSIPEMPTHTHSGNFANANSIITFSTGSSPGNAAQWGGASGVGQSGGNQSHENRPPYYVLVARQWIGY
jgi:hypothetical protein